MISKIDTLIPVVIFIFAWITGPLVIFLTSLFSVAAFAVVDGVTGGTSPETGMTLNHQVQFVRFTDIAPAACDRNEALVGQYEYYIYRSGRGNYRMSPNTHGGIYPIDPGADGDS
jgi:hypothetical protein